MVLKEFVSCNYTVWNPARRNNSWIHIPCYVIERKDMNKIGGGVPVYIKEDIQHSIRNDIENDKYWVLRVHKFISS